MKIGINKVIRTLILSDFILHSGWGLIGPIFAIFLVRQITGGTLATVGFVAAFFWITKSIVQPFIAYFLDVKKGEGDDFKFLVGGFYLANLTPLGYLFSTQIWHIFLLEFIRGLAMACVIPAWTAIFTRHIDKGWEAFSWSIESAAVGLTLGFAAAFGGVIASLVGFKVVFILTTLFGLISTSFLFSLRPQLLRRDHFLPKISSREKL